MAGSAAASSSSSCGAHRGSEEVALGDVAAEGAQRGELVGRFDALGDDDHPERVRHRGDALHDRRGALVAAQAQDERPVDLEHVDREAVQVRERRVAGAEVVERERDAELVQRLQQRDRGLGLVHERRLGELEAELVGGQAGALEDALDRAEESRGRRPAARRG